MKQQNRFHWAQYGLLSIPLAMLGLPIYIYLPSYYQQNYSISLAAIGSALLIARLLDVFTDPLIGYWSDRLHKTISRKQQILIGSITLSFSIYFLLLPSSSVVSWWQLFILSFVTYLAWTITQIPYLALAAELSNSPKIRTKLVSTREGLAIFGVLIILLLPSLVNQQITQIAFYQDFVLLFSLLLLTALISLSTLAKMPQNKAIEQRSKNKEKEQLKNPFAQLKLIKNHHPQALIIFKPYFFNSLANAIPATLFIIFVEQYLQLSEQVGLFLICYFLAGILSLPIWLKVANSYGRTQTWRASIMLAIFSFSAVFWLQPGDANLYLLICILTGLSLGVDIALPAAIQTDISQKVTQQSQNLNGFLFGIWGMLTKLSLAVAAGIALPLVDFIETSSIDTHTGLLILYAVPAIILKLVVWRQLKKLDQKLHHNYYN